jgi:hypothetical protein
MKPFNIDEAFNGVPFCVVDTENKKHLITDWGKNSGVIWCEVVGFANTMWFTMEGIQERGFIGEGCKLMLTS